MLHSTLMSDQTFEPLKEGTLEQPVYLTDGLNRSNLVDPYDKELNAREMRFVEAYVCGDDRSLNNAYRSGLVAGYTESVCATLSGWTLDPALYPSNTPGARKPHVFRAIQRRRAEIAERTALTDARIVEEVKRVAFFNYANIMKVTSDGDPYIDLKDMTMDELSAVSETTLEDFVDGRGEDAREVRRVKVKTHDKLAALTLLTKIFGMQKPDRVVHSNDPNNPVNFQGHDLGRLSEDELEVYLQLIRKMEGRETEEDKQAPILNSQKLVTVEEKPFANVKGVQAVIEGTTSEFPDLE